MDNPRPIAMVVDNDDNIREGLCLLLRSDGFEALSAKNGREALNQLRAQPDVKFILLDLMMPDMDGAAFRWAQLAEPKLADIPVIVMSAGSDSATTARSLHAVDHFKKPIPIDDLLHSVQRFR